MTAIDGAAVKIPAPYHFEANELNIIGGKYVFTYCSHWDRDQTEWNIYTSEHNIKANMPGGGTMCYMVSENPMDPNSWVFKGAYGPGVAGNNHSHLQKFKGNYYHIYHDHGSVLLDKMKSLGAVDASAGDYRSICVVKATVNESTATVNPVTLSIEGCDAIDTMNPYELQQVETMATGGGLEYEDFTNITKNGRINALGNDASLNMQVKMDAGDWTLVKKVDFGTTGASKFMLRAKGTGTLEIRAGRKGAKPSVTVEFSSTDMEDHVVELDPTKFQGTKTLYFLITSATDAYLDAWQFTEMGTDGIQTMEDSKPVKRQSFDLSGRRLSNSKQAHGVIIEQTIDANGVKHQRKHLSGKQ
jgi:arabinoxylan arabinofuranohydrolase